MPVEIERKFLVRDESWRAQSQDGGVLYRQGYLLGARRASLRVRLEGSRAFLNIKSQVLGIVRKEYEYPMPFEEAEEILAHLCEGELIEKIRYHVPYEGHLWEIDVFQGANAGLIVAEIELTSPEAVFPLPPWVGEEVSHDKRYYNVYLAEHPYPFWK
jgi:adenylate cyclase